MPKSTVFFWEEGGGFLTLGKVNGAKIDRFFFWGRGGWFLTFGKVNGAKIDRFFFGKKKTKKKLNEKSVPKSTVFSGGGGGFRSKTRFYQAKPVSTRGLVSAKVRGVPDILKGKAAAEAWSRRCALDVGVRGCEFFRVVSPWPGAPRRRR